jgi:hypothetical protein
VDLAFDVPQLLLHEARGVPDTLVVDGRTQLADEEVEKAFRPEVTQRVVELR